MERTLLITDIEGRTALAERLGDAAAAALWAAHDRVARELLVLHQGREIDRSDGFVVHFDAVADAAAFAIDREVHNRLHEGLVLTNLGS